MLAVKIYNKKEEREESFNKTIGNIVAYICETLNFSKARIASDSDCIEIVSGNTNIPDDDDQIVAELLIKKTIVINKSDFDNKEELDKFITKIKHFCEQANEIEEVKYTPLYYR
jgi:hypothetical protein